MPHMHGVSGFVAQGAPIRQVLRAVGSLIGPKAARHRGTELAGWEYGNDHQLCMGTKRIFITICQSWRFRTLL